MAADADHCPGADGLATATLAARLVTLPATNRPRRQRPAPAPALESASNVVDAATIIPLAGSFVSVLSTLRSDGNVE